MPNLTIKVIVGCLLGTPLVADSQAVSPLPKPSVIVNLAKLGWRASPLESDKSFFRTFSIEKLEAIEEEDLKFKYWPHLTIAVFVALAAFMFHRSSLQPVLASSDDDVKKLTEIVMQESKVTGLNPASIALEQKSLADTVTLVGATGLVIHAERDALLAAAKSESSDLKFSIATSGLQVHLYGDTAIVTYQREIKQFAPSEDLPIISKVVGRPFACIDTFIKRNGEWRVVARAAVPQSSIPDEVYQAAKTAAAKLPN